MGDVLIAIVDWMASLPAFWVYSIIFLVAWLENVVPPIPGDMVVVFGGYMAGVDLLSAPLVVALATIGGTLGFMSMYAVGHRVGTGLLDPGRFRWLPKKRILRVREKLSRRGFILVAANRFLSGLRSVISLTVGMSHMPAGLTWLWSAVSSLLWCVLLTVAGYVVGENWEIVSSWLRTWGGVVLALMALFVVVQVVRYVVSKRSNGNSA
ncbi:MAG: DedA family protein [Bacteroidota bacterium]|nr:DedA family protein [Bacteroidota bacterium]